MDRDLKRHPQSKGAKDHQVKAKVSRHAGTQLKLNFEVSGDLEQLKIPRFQKICPGDRLWEQTCFEVFVRSTSETAYNEFNFSPSGEWAAYAFDDYRAGMRPLEGLDVASLNTQTNSGRFRLALTMDLKTAHSLPANETWWMSISTVLEQKDGGKSYWALTHPSDTPDFHHSDCFVLELRAEEPS